MNCHPHTRSDSVGVPTSVPASVPDDRAGYSQIQTVEYMLNQPGEPPVSIFGSEEALQALQSAPVGSFLSIPDVITTEELSELQEPQAEQNGNPKHKPEWKSWVPKKSDPVFSALKIHVPMHWMPRRDISNAPAYAYGFTFPTICRLVLKYNRNAIKRNRGTWAVLVRRSGGEWSVSKEDIDVLHRPNDIFDEHPLCDRKRTTFDEAHASMIGINRKILKHSHSPRVWAVVTCHVPFEFRQQMEGMASIGDDEE